MFGRFSSIGISHCRKELSSGFEWFFLTTNKQSNGFLCAYSCFWLVRGERIKRQNAVRDGTCSFWCNAARGPVQEKPFILPRSSEGPAYISLPNFASGKSCPVKKKVCQASTEQSFGSYILKKESEKVRTTFPVSLDQIYNKWIWRICKLTFFKRLPCIIMCSFFRSVSSTFPVISLQV